MGGDKASQEMERRVRGRLRLFQTGTLKIEQRGWVFLFSESKKERTNGIMLRGFD
jgi:hypothetical protein